MEENNTQNTSVENNELPKGLSFTGLGLGIFSLTLGNCCGMNLLSAPIGLIISIIAIMKCNKGEQDGKVLALVGVGLNLFSLLMGIFVFFMYGMAMMIELANM